MDPSPTQRFYTKQLTRPLLSSALLALRAIKSAPRGLNNSPNGFPTHKARLAPTVVNQESFLVRVFRTGRAAEIEEAVTILRVGMTQSNSAAAFNRFGQDLANGLPEPPDLRLAEFSGGQSGRYACA